jgi:hypothetical protein
VIGVKNNLYRIEEEYRVKTFVIKLVVNPTNKIEREFRWEGVIENVIRCSFKKGRIL